MHSGIRLLSKPSNPKLCLLVCAVIKNDMSIAIEHGCYKIENNIGIKFEIYARNDDCFFKKLMRYSWNDNPFPTNPTISRNNNKRQ